uniref:Uncharacterized protein n=1 Tax=Echinococcus granulosus TaxID=6210 RepID=A0A068W795_ECHGR|nr:hypothetical protein EgrG_002013000 [Echinococcus granulosus]
MKTGCFTSAQEEEMVKTARKTETYFITNFSYPTKECTPVADAVSTRRKTCYQRTERIDGYGHSREITPPRRNRSLPTLENPQSSTHSQKNVTASHNLHLHFLLSVIFDGPLGQQNTVDTFKTTPLHFLHSLMIDINPSWGQYYTQSQCQCSPLLFATYIRGERNVDSELLGARQCSLTSPFHPTTYFAGHFHLLPKEPFHQGLFKVNSHTDILRLFLLSPLFPFHLHFSLDLVIYLASAQPVDTVKLAFVRVNSQIAIPVT